MAATVVTGSDSDLLSEQLIARLLETDLLILESAKQAERLQLDQVIAISARAQGRIPRYTKGVMEETRDSDLAFEMYVSEARVSGDAAYARAVQSQGHVADTMDRQYAQKLAAGERKFNLDSEFARKLQAIDDEGKDIDEIMDADSILGIHAAGFDPNACGKGFSAHSSIKPEADTQSGVSFDQRAVNLKGKGRELSSPQTRPSKRSRLDPSAPSFNFSIETKEESDTSFTNTPYPTCGICLELFLVTHSPITASLSANSSARLPFGLRLPCPKGHSYCLSCLTSYIQSKLDPEGRGVGKSSSIVFPIRCPECPVNNWLEGIQDEIAQRVLGEDGMVQWHHQKILDSIPRLFCPNPKCSSLVEADEDNKDPQALCPSCHQAMCVPCRSRWHTGLTCEGYQALPLDERSPEDRLLLELAKAQRWRRCPSCSVIVELVSGCNHMTCRCGFHFCFKCESPTTKEGKCQRQPPCELWDEELLLEERERARNPIAQYVPPPAPGAVQRHDDDLAWMDNPRVLCGRHWFTINMIRELRCGYCDATPNSLADLRYHLAHVQHPVYACCGRFFKRYEDLDRHDAAQLGRFGGGHAYRMVSE